MIAVRIDHDQVVLLVDARDFPAEESCEACHVSEVRCAFRWRAKGKSKRVPHLSARCPPEGIVCESARVLRPGAVEPTHISPSVSSSSSGTPALCTRSERSLSRQRSPGPRSCRPNSTLNGPALRVRDLGHQRTPIARVHASPSRDGSSGLLRSSPFSAARANGHRTRAPEAERESGSRFGNSETTTRSASAAVVRVCLIAPRARVLARLRWGMAR